MGTHYLVDIWQGRDLTADQWREVLIQAVRLCKVELLELKIHPFEPHGMTAFCLLSESHLAVHTWPERDYVAIDLFTCGDQTRPDAGIRYLERQLAAKHSQVRIVQRGMAGEPARPIARETVMEDVD